MPPRPLTKPPNANVLNLLIRLDFVLAVVLLVASPLGLRVVAALRVRLGGDPIAAWFRRWRVAAAGFCGASLRLTEPTLRCVSAEAGVDAMCEA